MPPRCDAYIIGFGISVFFLKNKTNAITFSLSLFATLTLGGGGGGDLITII